MTKQKIESKKIDDFLNTFTSPGTIRVYRHYLTQFFTIVEQNPDTYVKDIRRLENGERLDTLDQYEKDITKYWKWLINKEYAPKSVTNAIEGVRIFFREYRIHLDDVFWDKLKKRGTGSKPISKEEPLTKDILKQILTHGDAKIRSMALIMASSGMRVNELVQIKLDDLDFSKTPTKITISHTGRAKQSIKNKTSRITFISTEATESLKEWLKQREKMLTLSIKRTNFPNAKISIDDERVFPLQTNNVRRIWNNLLEKSGYNEKDKKLKKDRYVYHVYMLKKFFKTHFSRYDWELAELLMGHTVYLSPNYHRLTENELREHYKEGEKNISIFSAPVDLTGVHEELTGLKDENKEYKDSIQQLKERNERLERVSDHQFDRIQMLEHKIEDMSYYRAQDTTEEIKEKEYLKNFPTAKEREEDWNRIYNLMKTDKNMTTEEKSRYWFLNDRIYWRLRNKENIKKHWIDRLITPKGM